MLCITGESPDVNKKVVVSARRQNADSAYFVKDSGNLYLPSFVVQFHDKLHYIATFSTPDH